MPEGLRALSTDEFLLELARDDLEVVVDVIETQAAGLMNPPMTASEPELLDGLEAVGLVESVAVLRWRRSASRAWREFRPFVHGAQVDSEVFVGNPRLFSPLSIRWNSTTGPGEWIRPGGCDQTTSP